MISDLQLTYTYTYSLSLLVIWIIVLISDPTEWSAACKEREFNFPSKW